MRVSSPKRERRQEQLLDAALRVFSRRGFDAASVSDIADEAGVAKGSIYLYFDSKESLAGDLVRRIFTHDDGEGRPGAAEQPLQRLIRFCEGQERRILDLGEFSSIVLHMWGQTGKSDNSHVARGVRQFVKESAFYIATLLENAKARGELPPSLNTDKSARVLVAFCQGLVQHRLTAGNDKTLQLESCGSAIRVYLRGLGARI